MVKATNFGVGVMERRVRELSHYTSTIRFAVEHRLVQSGGLRAGLVRLCILRSGETMSEVNLVGGSQRDREQILKLHADYIDANSRFDWQKLEPIWSEAPEALFFN